MVVNIIIFVCVYKFEKNIRSKGPYISSINGKSIDFMVIPSYILLSLICYEYLRIFFLFSL